MAVMKRSNGATRAKTPAEAIVKALPPEKFFDFRDPDKEPDPEDATHDLALNAEMRWESLADEGYLTPNEHFFVRSHAPTPLIEASGWTLRVEGPGVERRLELGYEELQSLPAVTATQALECAGNGRVFFEERHGRSPEGTPWRLGAVGVAEWTGVPLREVLERAGLKGTAREVMVESLDAVRMRRPLPVEKALEHDTLLAFGMNGEPLPSDHGFPVRLIVPGWAAVASVKWVGSVHVSEHAPLLSPWNTQKYVLTGGSLGSRREPVTMRGVKSAVELPWPARLEAGRHTVTGRAWSGHGSISRVDYSVDGGASWHGARLFGPNVPGAWARWDFEWKATPGKYEIRVKATDDRGETQPYDVPWNDLGYLYGGVVGHPVEVY
jgi:DMSO/TMAO reductase YedYZ molybdopterin-dependent catalytic subunit